MKNLDLGKTQITDDIRVSSAAIWYESWYGDYYQVETWIFSKDKEKQRSVQVIHGTTSDDDKLPQRLIEKCAKVHFGMVQGLQRKHIVNK